MKNFTLNKPIPQPTRQAVRNEIKAFKSEGIEAKLVDNGSHLQGLKRWAVIPVKNINQKVRKTLSIGITRRFKREPVQFIGLDRETAHNAVQFQNERPTKTINVYHKSNYHRKMIHC